MIKFVLGVLVGFVASYLLTKYYPSISTKIQTKVYALFDLAVDKIKKIKQ